MVLTENKKAPAFTLSDKDGVKHKLQDIKSDYTVIFFYPTDSTPGCTIESIGFSKLKPQFDKMNTTVIGISGGDEKTKTKFCNKHNLKVLMLSDTDFKVSTKFGVYGEKKFMGRTYIGIKRITFILNKDKKIIKVYEKVMPPVHPKEVLTFIKRPL